MDWLSGLQEGDPVWVPDDTHGYVPGVVKSRLPLMVGFFTAPRPPPPLLRSLKTLTSMWWFYIFITFFTKFITFLHQVEVIPDRGGLLRDHVEARVVDCSRSVRSSPVDLHPRQETKVSRDDIRKSIAARKSRSRQLAVTGGAGAQHGPATASDCCSLLHLDAANILENVRKRYVADEIYTFTSTVLFAVNPYKELHLNTEAKRMEYFQMPNLHSKPPHPFSLADLAFRQCINDRENQAMVISGESGAGTYQRFSGTLVSPG